MSYTRAIRNPLGLNNMSAYDMVGDIRTNLLIEEVDSLKQIIKDLSQSVDLIREKLEKNDTIPGGDNENKNENKDSDPNDEEKKEKKNIEKRTWKSFLSDVKSRAFYYGVMGASVFALYCSRNVFSVPFVSSSSSIPDTPRHKK